MFKKIWQTDKRKVTKLVSGKNFDMFIMTLICMDAVILGFSASGWFPYLETEMFILDRLFMAIFIIEMIMKLYAFGGRFFKNGWNTFDLIIITIASVSIFSYLIILRAFRLFRLLKYVKRFGKLKQIINTFVALLPSFGAALAFFAIFFYVFAIMGVSLFGEMFDTTFGDLGIALFSLLQVMTLDNWANIARPIMIVYPYSWIFFVSFMFVSFAAVVSFIMTVVGDVINGGIKNNSEMIVLATKPKTKVKAKK